jgi:16S rRNA (cytidine1402-2'-O)-methyltransferase
MLHLIPTPLADNALHTIAPYLHPIISAIKIWCVEDVRTARRFLKAIDKSIDIDAITFVLVNKDTVLDVQLLTNIFTAGKTVGLMSEAGCAAVADPGSDVVALAQQLHIKVVPHLGPNSILMALMGSGFNGQKFMFHGYLPIKNPDRTKAIKQLEADSIVQHCTQLFIETPYRNNQMLQEMLGVCRPNTKICVAMNLTAADEYIVTKSVADWKKTEIDLHKKPVVFVLMG